MKRSWVLADGERKKKIAEKAAKEEEMKLRQQRQRSYDPNLDPDPRLAFTDADRAQIQHYLETLQKIRNQTEELNPEVCSKLSERCLVASEIKRYCVWENFPLGVHCEHFVHLKFRGSAEEISWAAGCMAFKACHWGLVQYVHQTERKFYAILRWSLKYIVGSSVRADQMKGKAKYRTEWFAFLKGEDFL